MFEYYVVNSGNVISSSDSVSASLLVVMSHITQAKRRKLSLGGAITGKGVFPKKISVRNFATEFKTLATILHKDDGTKIFDFKEKLKPEVQKGLAIATGLHNFNILVAKAIELDQTLFETAKAAKKVEQLQKSGTSSSSNSQQLHNKPPRPSGHLRPSGHPRPSGSQSSTSSPPLTNEEKDRREKNGLC
jgi:hypothetical protein